MLLTPQPDFSVKWLAPQHSHIPPKVCYRLNTYARAAWWCVCYCCCYIMRSRDVSNLFSTDNVWSRHFSQLMSSHFFL